MIVSNTNLHSTMVLLKLNAEVNENIEVNESTFHYGSIKMRCSNYS